MGSLIFANMFFCDTLFRAITGRKIKNAITISLIISEYQIQFVPYIRESFFWYNGGIYYTFFFSLLLIQISILIKFLDSKKVILWIFGIINALFIAGGNYSTALVSALIAFEFFFFSILAKKDFKPYLIIAVISVIGLLFSALAPGNACRGSNLEGMGAINAIGTSVFYAGTSIIRWTGISQIGFFALLILILFPFFKNLKGLKLKYPILLTSLCFLTFAALSTPAFYAMAIPGAGRQINIYYYAYNYVLIIPSLYIEGFLVSKFGKKIDSFVTRKFIKTVYYFAIILSIGSIIIGVGLNARNLTSVVNYLDLKSGRAQRYDSEYKRFERDIELCKDGICYTSDINEWPETFYRLEITDDSNWINSDMAEYYGIKKIIVDN